MVVQHNMTAINANRYLGMNNTKLGKSLEKLSSGYAINRAGDNAAGLAVSEKMRSQIAGMTQGVKNAQDGISMIQTYEGALTETDSILQRMKTLATQAANGTYDDGVDRAALELEFKQLKDEIDQIADTDFNGVVALNGGTMADGTGTGGGAAGEIDYLATPGGENTKLSSTTAVSLADSKNQAMANLTYTDKISLQVGARSKDLVEFTFKYESDSISAAGLSCDLNCTSAGLKLTDLNLETQEAANAAIDKIDAALNKTNMVRATFGAMQNRLEHKIDNMNVTVENLTSAESRIRDTDMATEMMNFTKQNILTQASQSMLAQANTLPQSVLSLLQ